MVKVVKEWDTLTPTQKVARVLGGPAVQHGFNVWLSGDDIHGRLIGKGQWTTREDVARLRGDTDEATVILLNCEYKDAVLALLEEAEQLAGVEITLVVRE